MVATRQPAPAASRTERARRDDLRLLGRLLGDTLREHEGRETYELVEGVRTLACDTQAWAGAHARCLRFMDERYGEEQVLGPYVEALRGPTGGVRA